MASSIKSPICRSKQIHTEKKGFSAGKALVGAILIASFLVAFSCGGHVNILPATDLSFAGFILGGSFKECYERAAFNNKIIQLSNHHYNRYEVNDSSFNYAYFHTSIPYYDIPGQQIFIGPVSIEAFKGIISDLVYSVEDKNHSKSIISMYQAKYGVVKPRKGHTYKNDYRKYNSLVYKWLFENGGIIITEKTHHIIPFSDQITYDGIEVRYYDRKTSSASYEYLKIKWDEEEKQQKLQKEVARERITQLEDY